MLLIPKEYQTETLIYYSNLFQLIGNYERELKLETTLNHKYAVDKSIPTSLLDKVKASYSVLYYGIGINGYFTKNGVKNPYRPNNQELDLYRPIPFRVVKSISDLTLFERETYRLPQPTIIDGEEYLCFYLKKVKQFRPEVIFYTVNKEGQESSYEITSDELFPTPSTNNYLSNSPGNTSHKGLSIEFNHLTLLTQEYEDIRKYYFDSAETFEISELGLYTGYDDDPNNKAYNVQLAYKFCNTGITIDNNNYSRNVKITVGNKLLV